jgi:hypothetical protein
MLPPDPAPLLSSLSSPLRHRMTLRLLWRIVLRGSGAKVPQNQYCCDVAVPPWGEGERTGSPALARPLDRNDGPSPRSAAPAPDALFEIEHLGLRAEPEP